MTAELNTPLDEKAYDTLWAAGWDDTRLYGPMARHSRRIIKTLTADLAPKSFIDIGCGEGSLVEALMAAHPRATATGLEIAPHAVRLAKAHVPGANFVTGDVSQKALDDTFDLVVCADVIEHIDDDTAAIKNMAAMTAPGGRLLIATLQGRMRAFEKQVGHVRNYAPGELQDKMRAAGLTIESVVAWGWPFYSPLYRDLLSLLGNKGTMGRFGPVRKFICHCLYALFMLNRSSKGDYLFVRAVKDS